MLTSDIFDFDDIEHFEQKTFENIFYEDKYDEIELSKQIEERLKNMDPGSLPDNLFNK